MTAGEHDSGGATPIGPGTDKSYVARISGTISLLQRSVVCGRQAAPQLLDTAHLL